MLLSIVTGTYQRRASLAWMIDSVGLQIPRHIEWEIVVVDGGSRDGTDEYVNALPNGHFVQQGKLLGAISAFCEGVRTATGDYVLLANDDITFKPFSIMRAIRHLETNPDCGAVAFADNRSAQLGYAGGARVEQAPAVLTTGQHTSLNYAQVGLFRRWLGDLAGWWGDKDDIMSHARTYGGDNYLSARIWEMGYTVDAVEGCEIDDQIIRDALRLENAQHGKQDSQAYYARYPEGPRYPGKPQIPNTQTESMRLVVLPIYESRYPGYLNKEYGLTEALAQYGLTWEIDYLNESTDIVRAVAAWQPHIMVLQAHGINARINEGVLSRCRQASPATVIVNWNGDAHEDGLISPEVLGLLRYVDLQMVVNAKVLPTYAREGINAAYWQIGYKAPAGDLPKAPRFSVVWLANCYSARRYEIAELLNELNISLGIYGNCPGSVGHTHYDFAMSAALYKACTLTISDTYPGTEGFVSNRLFQALGAGALVLQQYSPRLEEFTGLCAGMHFVEWREIDDLRTLIPEWLSLKRKKERARIAKEGQRFVLENYNYDAQVSKLFQLLPE
jgi:hypothetical protein